MVLGGFVGGFGWFWVVLGGFGWFRVLVTALSALVLYYYSQLFLKTLSISVTDEVLSA